MIIKNITNISWAQFVLHFAHKDANILQAPVHQCWKLIVYALDKTACKQQRLPLLIRSQVIEENCQLLSSFSKHGPEENFFACEFV